MYRNCGERGVIRHNTPSHNQIINNIFYYNRYTGGNPSVYIASRNGLTRAGRTGYCIDDLRGNYGKCDKNSNAEPYPYGSSEDDRDFSRYNVVMQNQIYKRTVSDMIRINNSALNSPNFIEHNTTVTEETVQRDRFAGCYVNNGYKTFILNGESIGVFVNDDGSRECRTSGYVCMNGNLVTTDEVTCAGL